MSLPPHDTATVQPGSFGPIFANRARVPAMAAASAPSPPATDDDEELFATDVDGADVVAGEVGAADDAELGALEGAVVDAGLEAVVVDFWDVFEVLLPQAAAVMTRDERARIAGSRLFMHQSSGFETSIASTKLTERRPPF
jgi:hypothetical protein